MCGVHSTHVQCVNEGCAAGHTCWQWPIIIIHECLAACTVHSAHDLGTSWRCVSRIDAPMVGFSLLPVCCLPFPGGPAKRQVIDGIVLTKFDTIDDKVGAALSMVYASGAPVMFVGCGQTYVDLKKLNVRSVVNSLLK